jgi:hypothetical protein
MMLPANRRKSNRTQASISEKEATMTYTKPEVAVLGQAVRVVEQNVLQKGNFPLTEFIPDRPRVNPAHDLDE